MSTKQLTREHWLNKAVVVLDKEFFKPNALEFAHEIKISTGWCRGSKKAIGQCWSNQCSTGDYVEIFIAPNLEHVVQVLATTLHELIHAHLGTGKGHGKEFKKIALLFGLAGRMTATFAAEGSELYARLQLIAEKLGEFPHKKLVPLNQSGKPEGEKKQKGWIRFKSINDDDYRVMVSPVSLEKYGIPKDPDGDELIPVKGE